MKKEFVEALIYVIHYNDCPVLTASGGLDQKFEGETDAW